MRESRNRIEQLEKVQHSVIDTIRYSVVRLGLPARAGNELANDVAVTLSYSRHPHTSPSRISGLRTSKGSTLERLSKERTRTQTQTRSRNPQVRRIWTPTQTPVQPSRSDALAGSGSPNQTQTRPPRQKGIARVPSCPWRLSERLRAAANSVSGHSHSDRLSDSERRQQQIQHHLRPQMAPLTAGSVPVCTGARERGVLTPPALRSETSKAGWCVPENAEDW